MNCLSFNLFLGFIQLLLTIHVNSSGVIAVPSFTMISGRNLFRNISPQWNETSVNIGTIIDNAKPNISYVDETITKDLFHSIMFNCSTLLIKSLHVSNSIVDESYFDELLKLSLSNSTQLESLTMKHCYFETDHCNAQFQPEHPNVHLQHLDLSFNSLSTSSISCLATTLKRLTSLSSVKLDGNAICVRSIRPLVKALRRHASISSVSLASCAIDDDTMTPLCTLLQSNHNISALDLQQNQITSVGFDKLVTTIDNGACKSLSCLDLSYNEIGPTGIVSLASSITSGKLPKLSHLVLKQIGADSKSVSKLFEALRNHSQIISVDLSGNKLFGNHEADKSKKIVTLKTYLQKSKQLLEYGRESSFFAFKSLQNITDSISKTMQTTMQQVSNTMNSESSTKRYKMKKQPLTLKYVKSKKSKHLVNSLSEEKSVNVLKSDSISDNNVDIFISKNRNNRNKIIKKMKKYTVFNSETNLLNQLFRFLSSNSSQQFQTLGFNKVGISSSVISKARFLSSKATSAKRLPGISNMTLHIDSQLHESSVVGYNCCLISPSVTLEVVLHKLSNSSLNMLVDSLDAIMQGLNKSIAVIAK